MTKSSAKQALKLRSQRHANLPTHMTWTTRTPDNIEQPRMRLTAIALPPEHCLLMQGTARTAVTCSPHHASWQTSTEASAVSWPLRASRPAEAPGPQLTTGGLCGLLALLQRSPARERGAVPSSLTPGTVPPHPPKCCAATTSAQLQPVCEPATPPGPLRATEVPQGPFRSEYAKGAERSKQAHA